MNMNWRIYLLAAALLAGGCRQFREAFSRGPERISRRPDTGAVPGMGRAPGDFRENRKDVAGHGVRRGSVFPWESSEPERGGLILSSELSPQERELMLRTESGRSGATDPALEDIHRRHEDAARRGREFVK